MDPLLERWEREGKKNPETNQWQRWRWVRTAANEVNEADMEGEAGAMQVRESGT
jgi:hypothetical protein